jgi:hypothetical protein
MIWALIVAWVVTTPLGRLVVPLVQRISARRIPGEDALRLDIGEKRLEFRRRRSLAQGSHHAASLPDAPHRGHVHPAGRHRKPPPRLGEVVAAGEQSVGYRARRDHEFAVCPFAIACRERAAVTMGSRLLHDCRFHCRLVHGGDVHTHLVTLLTIR